MRPTPHGRCGAYMGSLAETTGSRSRARRAASESSFTWSSSGERTPVLSERRCRRTSPTVSHAWPTCVPTPSTWSWTNGTARHRPDRRHARACAVGLPDVRLVAVAQRTHGCEGALDGAGGGRLGRLGRPLPRRRRAAARLDPVRAYRPLPP